MSWLVLFTLDVFALSCRYNHCSHHVHHHHRCVVLHASGNCCVASWCLQGQSGCLQFLIVCFLTCYVQVHISVCLLSRYRTWKLWTSTCGPASCLSSCLLSNMPPWTTAPLWRRWGRWRGGRSELRGNSRNNMWLRVSPMWSNSHTTTWIYFHSPLFKRPVNTNMEEE